MQSNVYSALGNLGVSPESQQNLQLILEGNQAISGEDRGLLERCKQILEEAGNSNPGHSELKERIIARLDSDGKTTSAAGLAFGKGTQEAVNIDAATAKWNTVALEAAREREAFIESDLDYLIGLENRVIVVLDRFEKDEDLTINDWRSLREIISLNYGCVEYLNRLGGSEWQGNCDFLNSIFKDFDSEEIEYCMQKFPINQVNLVRELFEKVVQLTHLKDQVLEAFDTVFDTVKVEKPSEILESADPKAPTKIQLIAAFLQMTVAFPMGDEVEAAIEFLDEYLGSD